MAKSCFLFLWFCCCVSAFLVHSNHAGLTLRIGHGYFIHSLARLVSFGRGNFINISYCPILVGVAFEGSLHRRRKLVLGYFFFLSLLALLLSLRWRLLG